MNSIISEHCKIKMEDRFVMVLCRFGLSLLNKLIFNKSLVFRHVVHSVELTLLHEFMFSMQDDHFSSPQVQAM